MYSPVNLAFDLSLIAFYDFIFVSCLSCLEVCPNESLPKSKSTEMVTLTEKKDVLGLTLQLICYGRPSYSQEL